MHYTIMIYGEDGAYERLPEAEKARILEGHKALQAALAKRGPFATAKLMAASAAVTLQPTPDGQEPLVLDGPFADTKERFLGFYAAEFSDLDDAIAHARYIATPQNRVEIRPIQWAGGVLAPENTHFDVA